MDEMTETDKLWNLIKSIDVAMMVTQDGDYLRGRPMARIQDAFDGNIWFFTRATSHKTDELNAEEQVNLSYAHPGKQHYVSVSGRATIERDRGKIDQYWSEAMRVWFPKGREDPDIALLKIRVQKAEYWDAPSSTMLHAYGYIKAMITGQSPQAGEHGTLHLDVIGS